MHSDTIHFSKWRNCLLAIGIGGSYFVWGLIYTVQAPFYPKEALKRGANMSQSGLVFGMLHLSGFIASLAFGIVGHRFSSRNMAFLGSFLQGVTVILFGMLEFVHDKDVFLTISFISRAVEGVGSSIAMSSFTVIVIELYPEKVGTITSWSETALGLGYSIGPAIGGFLYDNGGFHLPFTVIGVSNILFAIMMMLALTKEESITTTTKEKSGGSYTSIIKIILGNPRIIISFVDNLVCCMGFSMLESTYAQYLDIIHGRPMVIRTTFVLMGIFNIVGKLITGNILDRSDRAPVICSLVGNVLMILDYLVVATSPQWYIDECYQQWFIMASSPMLTCGFVLVFISTLSRMYQMKLSNNNIREISTLISGMWNSARCLGMFLGPSIGGTLIDNHGYQATALVFIGIYCLPITADLMELWIFNGSISQGLQLPETNHLLKSLSE